MKKVEKLTNYEHVLTCMVDDINKEIDTCYMTCQKISSGQLSKVINIFTKKALVECFTCMLEETNKKIYHKSPGQR